MQIIVSLNNLLHHSEEQADTCSLVYICSQNFLFLVLNSVILTIEVLLVPYIDGTSCSTRAEAMFMIWKFSDKLSYR